MRKLVLVGVVGVLLGLVASAGAEDRKTIGGLSFALPSGWKFEIEAGDHARLTHAGATRYCIVSLYQSRAAGSDLDADFATEWKSVGGALADQAATPARRKLGGRTIIEASAATKLGDAAVVERVGVLDGGAQITTLVIFTANAADARAYQSEIDGLYTSIQFPAAPAAEPAPAPAPAQVAAPSRPDRVLIGTMKPSVTMADLAGTWSLGAGNVVSYVDTATGNHAGTSTSFYGEQYTIKSNGTFAYLFVGRASNHTVRETDSGKVTLSGGTVTFQFKGSRGTKKFQLIAYVDQPNGASVISFTPIGASRGGQSSDWIAANCGVVKGVYHCVGGTEWGRSSK